MFEKLCVTLMVLGTSKAYWVAVILLAIVGILGLEFKIPFSLSAGLSALVMTTIGAIGHLLYRVMDAS